MESGEWTVQPATTSAEYTRETLRSIPAENHGRKKKDKNSSMLFLFTQSGNVLLLVSGVWGGKLP